jgi:glycosyltransferase involved in cell wall biosynthesis
MTSVSVVIPSYNAATYLPQALASIRTQLRAPDEIVVVDDGSTDDSPELARRAGARVLRTPTNGGPAAARNLGIREARGDVVAFLDADDLWEPTHLAVLLQLLERHPSAVLAFSRERRIGGWEGEHPRVLPENEAVDAFWPLLRKNFIPQMGVVARRDALSAVGGYDESMRYAEDYDLWLRLALRFPFLCTRE